MSLQNFLSELGSQMGLPSLKLDAQGLARLVFDGRIVIDIEDDADARCVHLYSVLGSLPAEGREALYEQLLGANLFGTGTGGAVFAVDTLQNEIVLSRTLSTDRLDFTAFSQALESLVNQVESWTGRLNAPAAEARETSDSDLPMTFGTSMMRA